MDWVKDRALPLWHHRGWDFHQGGFVERLDANGVPDPSADRRVRVQARQIYVYAHAATLGWYEPARQLALDGFDWFMTRCRRGRGFVHCIRPDGAIVDGRIDAYDQSFALLAFAWMFRLTRDAQIRAVIDEHLAQIDDEIADHKNGGWKEGVPASVPRRQNPQMHAFEAMLALYEATGDIAFLRRAEGFLELLESRLFCPEHGVLLEEFGPDFERPEDPAGLVVEPGHHFEWVWLLARYARLSDRPVPALVRPLYDWAMRHGLAEDGSAIDRCRPDGGAISGMRRLWPQTELAKANLALEEHGLAPEAAQRADAALAILRERYLTRHPEGGWIDQIDDAGRVSAPHMPASSFYHIFCAVAEAARLGSLANSDRQGGLAKSA